MIRAVLIIAAFAALLFAVHVLTAQDERWTVDTTSKYKGHGGKPRLVAVCENRWGEEIDVVITERQLAVLAPGDPCPR